MTVYASISPPETEQTSRVIAHEEIALHAYYHWQRRGRPFGSPEVDWYWAIRELEGRLNRPSLYQQSNKCN